MKFAKSRKRTVLLDKMDRCSFFTDASLEPVGKKVSFFGRKMFSFSKEAEFLSHQMPRAGKLCGLRHHDDAVFEKKERLPFIEYSSFVRQKIWYPFQKQQAIFVKVEVDCLCTEKTGSFEGNMSQVRSAKSG